MNLLNIEKSISTMLLLPEVAIYLIPYVFPRELIHLIVSFMLPQPYFLEEHKNGEISKDGKSSSTLATYSFERYARTCKLQQKPGTKVKFVSSNTQGSYQSQLNRFRFYYYCDGRTNNEIACSSNSAYEDTNHFELHFNNDSTFTLLINNVIQPTKHQIPKEFFIYFGLYNSGSMITLPSHDD